MALTPRQSVTLDAIKQSAAKYNVDWRVMAALAHHESNLGQSTYGDGGHAIGPFQLNNAGGVLTGTSPQEFQSYASPLKNANYAAQALAKLGIVNGSGTVESQIAQGVNRFERPADKPSEIQDATSWYQSTLKGKAPAVSSVATGGKVANTSTQPMAQQLQPAPQGNDALRNGLLQYVMGQNTTFAGGNPSSSTPSLPSLLSTALTASKTGTTQQAAQLPTLTGRKVAVHVEPGVIPNRTTTGAIKTAEKFLNTPYKFGGASPQTGFDCSGLVQYAFGQNGVKVPRTSQEQWKAGKPVDTKQMKPGDIVFFAGSDGTMTSPGHEGIFLGNDQFLEAPHTGDVVKIAKLSTRTDYVGARSFQ